MPERKFSVRPDQTTCPHPVMKPVIPAGEIVPVHMMCPSCGFYRAPTEEEMKAYAPR